MVSNFLPETSSTGAPQELILVSRLLRGVNGGSKSDPNPTNKRRDLALIAGLIDHPTAGLILFETGCAEDVDVKWGAPITDVFPRTTYNEEHKLPAAIKAAGYDIKDVKKVIIGHLHLDHAGGLEHFVGTKSKLASLVCCLCRLPPDNRSPIYHGSPANSA